MRKNRASHLLAALLFIAALPSGLQAENPLTVSLLGITFQTELRFSAPQELGLDAYSLVFPATAKPDSAAMEIILVRMDAEMQKQMGGSDKELLAYGKAAFLGITGQPKEKITRRFAGKPVQGEIHASAIPRPSRTEIHLIPLKDGAKLMISFRSYAAMNGKQSEKVVTMAADTFHYSKP